jgi:hypothetical protein
MAECYHRVLLPQLSSVVIDRVDWVDGRVAIAAHPRVPRTAVVVEDQYSQAFQLDRVRPARSPTGPVGPASRSCSPKPVGSPRNGPTATCPQPGLGKHLSLFAVCGSIWSNYLFTSGLRRRSSTPE